MKDIFLGFLAQTLNKPAEEIAELLYQKGEDGNLTDDMVENAAELLKQWDVERVQRLRSTSDNKKALDDQYKRGKKEALTDLEKALMAKYEIESDKTGADLIDEIVAKTAKSDLPEDKVKRHPLYLALEKRLADEIKALSDQHKTELDKLEGDYTRKFTLADVKQRALAELEKLNPILPENANIASNYKQLFARAFEDYGYERQEDGSLLILKGDKRLEDVHANPVGFDKLVKETAAQFFTFKQQGEKGNAGNKNDGGQGGGNGSMGVPKDVSEAWEMYAKAKTPEERKSIMEAIEKLE